MSRCRDDKNLKLPHVKHNFLDCMVRQKSGSRGGATKNEAAWRQPL